MTVSNWLIFLNYEEDFVALRRLSALSRVEPNSTVSPFQISGTFAPGGLEVHHQLLRVEDENKLVGESKNTTHRFSNFDLSK
ncbi:MAG: hypothetical protein R3A47_02855 [Polyangiales bacterium]